MSLAPNFKWNVNRKSVDRIANQYLDRSLNSLQIAVEDAASFSANWIREFKIGQGSRTGTLWHDYINEERGNRDGARQETGLMYNSVGHTSAEYQSEGEYKAEFGLKLPSAGGRKYFLEQDEGFDLQLASGKIRKVPGMHTFDAVLPQLKRRMNKEMLRRGFLRGKKDSRGMRILQNAQYEGFNTAWSNEYSQSDAQIVAMREMVQRGADARLARNARRAAQVDVYRSAIKNTYESATQAFRRSDR